MKKIACFLLMVTMAVTLAACKTPPSSGSSSLSQNTVPESSSLSQGQGVASEGSSASQSQKMAPPNSGESFWATEGIPSAMESETPFVSSSAEEISDNTEATEKDEKTMDQKVLVAYFSATGTTRPLAEYAADILNADLYEIIAAEPYTDADLAYYTGGRADQEQNDPSARPGISGSVENLAQYDTILLGYPIWHGQAPRIIRTFLESHDFSGKTIIPFCTSHSSGAGSSADNLHSLCSDTAEWMGATRFAGGTSKSEIAAWLDSMLPDR
jgi:flavodoxin